MTKSIIFKVDDKTKLMVEQKAKKLNITVSEYLRLLVNNNLESRKNNNPLLKLANTLTSQEADMMMKSIKSDRVNRK
jgi:antitoxin component of RelBE/YafQ-DinJ toxin-antitoxin module